MIKVLIVDDEPYVRKGLQQIIPWEANGFSICGEGVDGKDGLKKTLELQPDLLLVDIKMPGLSGIEMLEQARSAGFRGKVIILTGYSDFKYAQQAIYLSVKAYQLKPIDEDDLLKVILEIKKEIEIENAESKNQKLDEATYKEFVLRKRILSPVNDSLTQDEQWIIENYFKYEEYHTVLIDFYDNNKSADLLQEVFKYMNQFCQEHIGMHFLLLDEQGGIVVNGKNTIQLEAIFNHLYNQVYQKFEIRLLIVVGKKVNCFEEMMESFQDAKALLGRKFFFSDQQIVFSDLLQRSIIEDLPENYLSLGDKIYTWIQIADNESINNLFRNIENLFRTSMLSAERVKGICVNCYVAVKEKFVIHYIEHKDLFNTDEAIMDEIYNQPNLHELLTFLKETFISISHVIATASSDGTFKKILNYIHKNYNQDLKLDKLAELFCYNSAYLGKLFKSQTGNSFNEYLEMIRIDHAKRLLQSENYKIYEVALKVGYKNVDYFTNKFRKYANTSPKEYQKEFNQQESFLYNLNRSSD